MEFTRPRSKHGLGRRTFFLVLAGILGTSGLMGLGWAGWSLASAALVDARQGYQLEERMLRHEAATTQTPSLPGEKWPEVMSEGDLVGRIEMDRIGISAIILAGTEPRTLRRAVGHIGGTSLPGQGGNVGMAGHRDSFFRSLADVDIGDVVRLQTPVGTMSYQVTRVFVVDPEDVHVLDPEPEGEVLTLVTCYPFYFVGPAPQRFIVRAQRVATPSPRQADVPEPG